MSGGPMDRAVDLATIKAAAVQAAMHPMMPKAMALGLKAMASLLESQEREIMALRVKVETLESAGL